MLFFYTDMLFRIETKMTQAELIGHRPAAQWGSVARAAKHLAISQPAVSAASPSSAITSVDDRAPARSPGQGAAKRWYRTVALGLGAAVIDRLSGSRPLRAATEFRARGKSAGASHVILTTVGTGVEVRHSLILISPHRVFSNSPPRFEPMDQGRARRIQDDQQ
jgi:hypothetical protein